MKARDRLDEVVDECNARLTRANREYLQASGWVESCESPGSFWLWRRNWRGKDYTAPTDFAVTMQGHIDQFEEQG